MYYNINFLIISNLYIFLYRYIVLHAGGKDGFVPNASLIFGTKSKLADYHGDMNGEMFLKWVEEQLLPNLEEPSLIVMDNAPYHSMEKNKMPNSSWRVGDIKEWLANQGVAYEEDMFKRELLSLVKNKIHKKIYIVDEIIREHGHEVLRLPPYHCDFNAIEMVWAEAKDFYNKHIGAEGHCEQEVKELWRKALEKVTPEAWSKKVQHTDKIIQDWYQRERFVDDINEVVINMESDSDEEENVKKN